MRVSLLACIVVGLLVGCNAQDRDGYRAITVGSMSVVSGLALDGEMLYATNNSTHTIHRSTDMGRFFAQVAGAGFAGHNDGPVDTATFNNPLGLAVDKKGIIYICDEGNGAIRVIKRRQVTTLVSGLNGPREITLIESDASAMHVVTRSGTVWISNAPENDQLSNALQLDVSVPVSLTGTLTGAHNDKVPNCGRTRLHHSIWYRFVGTGTQLKVSLCQHVPHSFDTYLQVFTNNVLNSTDHSKLICVKSNDDHCSSRSEVKVCAQTNRYYWVAVSGYSQSSKGDFQLDITDQGSAHCSNCYCSALDQCGLSSSCKWLCGYCPNNTVCKERQCRLPNTNWKCDLARNISLVAGLTVSLAGDTSISLDHTEQLGVTCGTWQTDHAQTQWYRFVGNGNTVIVSTCDGATHIDTLLRVFDSGADGTCADNDTADHMSCAAANRDFTCPHKSHTSTVSFCGHSNHWFYVSVEAYDGKSGPFGVKFIDTGRSCT